MYTFKCAERTGWLVHSVVKNKAGLKDKSAGPSVGTPYQGSGTGARSWHSEGRSGVDLYGRRALKHQSCQWTGPWTGGTARRGDRGQVDSLHGGRGNGR